MCFYQQASNMEKTIKVTNKQQLSRLVDLIEENPDIGSGKRHHGSSRQNIKDTWDHFAIILNNLGPPFRTGPEWQRVWIHYKANLKRKLAKNAGGPLQEICLTPTEERVYGITHINLSLDNDDASNESSLLTPIKPPDVKPTPSTAKRLKAGEAKIVLLKRQVQTQTEILRTLRKLEETKYKEFVLKKRKLELIEKSEERKSVLRELKIKLAEAKLEKLTK